VKHSCETQFSKDALIANEYINKGETGYSTFQGVTGVQAGSEVFENPPFPVSVKLKVGSGSEVSVVGNPAAEIDHELLKVTPQPPEGQNWAWCAVNIEACNQVSSPRNKPIRLNCYSLIDKICYFRTGPDCNRYSSRWFTFLPEGDIFWHDRSGESVFMNRWGTFPL